MSLIPFAPLYLGCSRSARPLPRGCTGHEIQVRFAPHPICSIQFVRSIGMEVSPFRDMQVLIADDEKDVGKALADMVRSCNHEIVSVVSSGLEAIHAYSRFRPDLVLMDYRMSKLNGATACRNIRSKDPAARVILISAWSPSDDATASGAIAFLAKPVDLERLNAVLNSVAATLSAPSPAKMPNPEISYQPDLIDYSQAVPQPSPVVPPSSEMSFHVDATTSHLQQSGEACALDEEKISGTRRSIRRKTKLDQSRREIAAGQYTTRQPK